MTGLLNGTVVLLLGTTIGLYWIGGEKWAHTLFRDLGCPLCIVILALHLLGFHYELFPAFLIAWLGMTIGDKGKFYWSIHGFVIGLGFIFYAMSLGHILQFLLMMTVTTGGTYLVSRFANKYGIDVFGRGLLYATIPIWFLIK